VCLEESKINKFVSSEKPCSYLVRYTSVIAYCKAQIVLDKTEDLRALDLNWKSMSTKEILKW